jgi:hypothetical protein
MGNTGYKFFASLEQYYTDDNSSVGVTKPNIVTDPDYIAPFLDTTSCPPSTRFYNEVKTLTVTKNDCSSGYAGSSITLTANANQFVSAISVSDANSQADSWLAANAQAYANTSGTCTLDNAITITSYSEGNLYFTISGAEYSPSAFTVNTSTTSSTGPWTNNTSGVTSPRSVGVPTVTTWYRIQDAITPSILSNVYQYVVSGGGSGGGGGGCFVEGTLIALPDGTQMPIETLVMNQLLLSGEIETLHDTNNVLELYKWNSSFFRENRIASPITKIEPKIAYETIIINEGLLEATPSHSQLIQRDGVWKFIPLGNVAVGDNLYGINKEIIEITSVLVSLEKRNIYPLILNPSHTYFANGILTHNNKQPIDPELP